MRPTKFTADLQGNDALEKLGSNIPVGAQIKVVGPGIENHRFARRSEGMNMSGQQRDHRGFRHQGEAFGCDGGKQGRPVAVGEKRAFAGTAGLK